MYVYSISPKLQTNFDKNLNSCETLQQSASYLNIAD